jgi:hypothetical protein
MMTVYPAWRDLPFREIWCVDTEFYPGPGKANGGVDGDPSTPLCSVAQEMRFGRPCGYGRVNSAGSRPTGSTPTRAGVSLELHTQLGWIMQCPPGINPRTVRNFPMQSTGSEILHVTCVLAERRGIEVVAPVHDALMAQAPIDLVDDVSAALDRAMRDAAAIVLRGYPLPTDEQRILPGQRYQDDRGEAMWNTVSKLVARRQEQSA